jgi:hypothetical protein
MVGSEYGATMLKPRFDEPEIGLNRALPAESWSNLAAGTKF